MTCSNFIKLFQGSDLNRIKIITALILTLISAASTLAIPQIIGIIFDPNLGMAILESPYILLYGIAAALIIYGINSLSTYMLGDIGIDMMVNFQKRTFENTLFLPYSKIVNLSAGDLSSRLTNDIGAVTNFISILIPELISNIIIIIGSFIFLLSYDIKLTMLIISLLPILIIGRLPLNLKLESLSTLSQKKIGTISSFIVQRVVNIRLVKFFVAENTELLIGSKYFKEYGNVIKAKLLIQVLAFLITTIIIYAYILLVFYFTYKSYITEDAQVANLITYFLYLFTIVNPTMDTLSIILKLSEVKGAILRLTDIIDMDRENSLGHTATDFSSIHIRDLTFSYPDNPYKTLKLVNLEISQPSLTAIVGPSGSGKSTLLSLLMKLYPNYNGSIKIGRQEVKELSAESLRRNIALIDQKQELFPGTIRDNLLYGQNREIDESKVWKVLDVVNASSFIYNLPAGLDTEMNKGSTNLSEGQKQRISIARAILTEPQIFLFDEPTSNLDGISEEFIRNLCEKLSQDHIVIIITHQIHTVKNADQIVVFSELGHILESGDYEFLISNSYHLQKLYSKHTKD